MNRNIEGKSETTGNANGILETPTVLRKNQQEYPIRRRDYAKFKRNITYASSIAQTPTANPIFKKEIRKM
jgi:ribosomal protein S30